MGEIRRIVIYGPESTGKTLLTQNLAEHFHAPWSREYVRDYWEGHQGLISSADLDAIGRGQLAGEEKAERHAMDLVFCDTDLLTCRIWDDLLFPGACPDWVRREGQIRAKSAALYLFCDIDLPWKPDPQRSFPDPDGREMCRQTWQTALCELGVDFHMIRGDGEGRLITALEAVKHVLKR